MTIYGRLNPPKPFTTCHVTLLKIA